MSDHFHRNKDALMAEEKAALRLIKAGVELESIERFRALKNMVGQTFTWHTRGMSGEATLVSYEEHDAQDCDCDDCRKDRGK